ncbi:MAG TPA: alpha/beta fold hydrolase [Candidatus Sulfotelmatobacter sp.]|nr:alpha/beta fold hydrolase [Candidatus Sulfotelmatobacter sp.]
MERSDADELDADAADLIEALTRPKRRIRPRLAEALRSAEERDVATPQGGVKAWRFGAGRATLLVHGWDDDNCLWGALAEKFAEIGRAVVALDLPGHGFSPAEDPSLKSAAAAIDAVARSLGPIDSIVAHSFGCPASVAAMVNGLPIGRIALVATPLPNAANRWARAKRAGVPQAVIDRAAELYAARPDAAEPVFDMAAAVPSLQAKALFVHSLDDDQCPAADAERLRGLWPGAKLALMDGLGHRLIAQDAATLARIVAFIDAAD